MDKNTQSGLDARAAKALDGLSLTPRPKPAVQQEVSQDPFTDRALSRAQRRRARDAESPTRLTQVARHAGRFLKLSSPLLIALNPECKDFDAELRRAWLRLDKQTRREIDNFAASWPSVWRPDAAVAGPDHTHAGGTAVDGEPGATAATGKLLTVTSIETGNKYNFYVEPPLTTPKHTYIIIGRRARAA